jgi:predicted transcriptional regulator
MAKDLTAIRIDGDLVEGLKKIITNAPKNSVYRDRSVNWLIGRAVEEFIDRHKSAAQAAAEVKPDADPKQGF